MCILFFYIVITGADLQGVKRLSAVNIELTEKFKALQTQVMDEAAQNVKSEVEGVAYNENNGKCKTGK